MHFHRSIWVTTGSQLCPGETRQPKRPHADIGAVAKALAEEIVSKMSLDPVRPKIGVKLSLMPFEEVSEVFADRNTTLGELKQHVIASSDFIPPSTKASELKAWSGGGEVIRLPHSPPSCLHRAPQGTHPAPSLLVPRPHRRFAYIPASTAAPSAPPPCATTSANHHPATARPPRRAAESFEPASGRLRAAGAAPAPTTVAP